MNLQVTDLWHRAHRSLATARTIAGADPDAAASRAYYAAFYAVSALFALESRDFTKHSAIEAAVHRDLVKTGRWPIELGQDYHDLRELRGMGDYGRLEHVTLQAAQEATKKAQAILDTVQQACPKLGNLLEKP